MLPRTEPTAWTEWAHSEGMLHTTEPMVPSKPGPLDTCWTGCGAWGAPGWAALGALWGAGLWAAPVGCWAWGWTAVWGLWEGLVAPEAVWVGLAAGALLDLEEERPPLLLDDPRGIVRCESGKLSNFTKIRFYFSTEPVPRTKTNMRSHGESQSWTRIADLRWGS